MLSRETRRSSFGIAGDRVLLGVGHATALHSGRPRDVLCGKGTVLARETSGALRCRGGLRPKFWLVEGIGQTASCRTPTAIQKRRSDLLTGSGSRLDIENINLLATLLVHAQYRGYWGQLGMQFQEEMEALLERHVLKGLVDAPWVRTDDPESDDDDRFFAALQELVAYAFEESARIKKEGRLFPGWHEDRVRSSRGIL